MTSSGVSRVLFVDDNSDLMEGLRARFELESDLDCIGALTSAADLVGHVKQSQPDIVVIDIEMPGPDPFRAITALTRECPEARAVFLSASVRDDYITRAVNAGAWGYLSKTDEVDAILDSIRRIARGEFTLSPIVQSKCRSDRAS